MSYLIRSNFQDHPFHLVSPSPWPLYTSFSLLVLTTTTVLSMHNFYNAYYLFFIGFILLISSMLFWVRDVVAESTGNLSPYMLNIGMNLLPYILKIGIYSSPPKEGTQFNHKLNIAKAIPIKDVFKALNTYKASNSNKLITQKDLGYYLAGLLEGDGCISIPKGTTTLNRVYNPRIVFTSHINNFSLYAFIQSELNNVGRFQTTGKNALRYIIGDKDGIILFINLIHNKLRTPKNKRFNDLIKIFNAKYFLNIPESLLDNSNFSDNSWFTGFTEADGHFGIRYVETKSKSKTSKRSISESIGVKFRLDQRLYDKPTSSSMKPFMESLALFLSCNLKNYTNNTGSKVLSLSVSSINSVKFLIDYFNKYPLLGNKINDFNKWVQVYTMIISKQHLTHEGRLKIKTLMGKI